MTNPKTTAAAVREAADLCGSMQALGESVGVRPAYARQVVWAWQNRNVVPIEYCWPIEQITGGAVSRRRLRPDDWHRIWPDLVSDSKQAA
jgi:DNA-binding transcriptional regulator YdaS (Cro superfamily)